METPKVEKFVKKRGISRSSDTRDSESLGICEKTGDFKFRLLDGQQVLDDDSKFIQNLQSTENRVQNST